MEINMEKELREIFAAYGFDSKQYIGKKIIAQFSKMSREEFS